MVLNGDPTLRLIRRGDIDVDGDVDTADFTLLETCFTGPDGGPLPWECVLGDFNGDDDIDCEDWNGFQLAWTETSDPPVLQPCFAECGNGLVEYGELCDIAIVPGESGACPTDCTSEDPCVIATLVDPGTCTARCEFDVITERIYGDDCCPEGANAIIDTDCEPLCGNAVCEGDEPTACPVDCLCVHDDDCDDGFVCTYDQCLDGICTYTPGPYGDVDHNSVRNLMDVFCILDGIAGEFSTCSLKDVDIHPCARDGVANLFDVFAVLGAIAGTDPCCGG
jgi:hypothetical protein